MDGGTSGGAASTTNKPKKDLKCFKFNEQLSPRDGGNLRKREGFEPRTAEKGSKIHWRTGINLVQAVQLAHH